MGGLRTTLTSRLGLRESGKEEAGEGGKIQGAGMQGEKWGWLGKEMWIRSSVDY